MLKENNREYWRNKGNKLKLPDMILFDYGNTLVHEHDFDGLTAMARLLDHAVVNLTGVTPERLKALNDEVYSYLAEQIHPRCIEVHQREFFRLLFDTFGLRFDMPFTALEQLYWNTASPGTPAPGIAAVMERLFGLGIRTGVVSNISFSRETMTERLDRLIPNNRFEFVVCSSEYGFRKPDPHIFGAALGLAGLSADRVWFCGDNPDADVRGAAEAGMFPVWYQSPLVCSNIDPERTGEVSRLMIFDWNEFEAILDSAAQAIVR